eukprot:3396028-Alexandrium_andersonii.AAC.1
MSPTWTTLLSPLRANRVMTSSAEHGRWQRSRLRSTRSSASPSTSLRLRRRCCWICGGRIPGCSAA